MNLRVGLVGLGAMGRNHLRVLEASSLVSEILAFDPAVSDEFSSKKSVHVQTLADLLEANLDYMVIASPTSSHLDIAIAAARSKVPCLIEKPIAATLHDAIRIKEEFQAAGTFAAVGHAERFNSSIMALKEKIDSGVLGDIYHVSTERVGPNPVRIRDVGVVLDLATHDLDIVRWVMGDEYHDLSVTVTRQPDNAFEALFVANGRLESGVSVSHNVNWLTPLKRREVTVLGERGMLVADAMLAELRLYSSGTAETSWAALDHMTGSIVGEEVKFALGFDEPLKLEHGAMAAEIRGRGETSLCKLGDAIGVLRIIDDFAK